MSLTRTETLEYLAGYESDAEKIALVLLELGEDPDGDEFPDDIVERAETFFQALGKANKNVLAAGKQEDVAIAVQAVSTMTFQILEQQGISLPMEVIAALAQSKVQESIELADRVSELQKRTFAKRLAHNQTEFAKDILRLASKPTEAIDAILSDEAQMQWIDAAVPQQSQLSGEVQTFVAMLDSRRKAQKQVEGKRQEEVKTLPPQDPKKVLGAFLASMKG